MVQCSTVDPTLSLGEVKIEVLGLSEALKY